MKTQRKLTKKLRRAYGEHALSRTQVFRWHNHFWMAVRVWKTNLVVEDLARQKTGENVTKVRDLVRSDRRLTE